MSKFKEVLLKLAGDELREDRADQVLYTIDFGRENVFERFGVKVNGNKLGALDLLLDGLQEELLEQANTAELARELKQYQQELCEDFAKGAKAHYHLEVHFNIEYVPGYGLKVQTYSGNFLSVRSYDRYFCL